MDQAFCLFANHVPGPEIPFRFHPGWTHDTRRDFDVVPIALTYFDHRQSRLFSDLDPNAVWIGI